MLKTNRLLGEGHAALCCHFMAINTNENVNGRVKSSIKRNKKYSMAHRLFLPVTTLMKRWQMDYFDTLFLFFRSTWFWGTPHKEKVRHFKIPVDSGRPARKFSVQIQSKPLLACAFLHPQICSKQACNINERLSKKCHLEKLIQVWYCSTLTTPPSGQDPKRGPCFFSPNKCLLSKLVSCKLGFQVDAFLAGSRL